MIRDDNDDIMLFLNEFLISLQLTLECIVESYPEPYVVWRRGGKLGTQCISHFRIQLYFIFYYFCILFCMFHILCFTRSYFIFHILYLVSHPN